ncbi:hypothetical protein A33Q_3500 [Indibacter alkaliphilus LW1]|uniref:Uncharacterized protein n=1 Tax=Indibacter alkaliphilus (strain CCUG 57479 / KCTC 22604 / LW1) TaxID=1189612 RepID=S2D3V9_INDAL|nr:hypothetical protein A33Q_3500 [Indibacter alkaliphilus LW1]
MSLVVFKIRKNILEKSGESVDFFHFHTFANNIAITVIFLQEFHTV